MSGIISATRIHLHMRHHTLLSVPVGNDGDRHFDGMLAVVNSNPVLGDALIGVDTNSLHEDTEPISGGQLFLDWRDVGGGGGCEVSWGVLLLLWGMYVYEYIS